MPRARRVVDLSPAAFEKAAIAYLERFSSSREQLRRVLARRIRRAGADAATDGAAALATIDALIASLERRGLLDDRRFAEGRARSLSARGRSQGHVREALRAQGVPEPAIALALDRLGVEIGDAELAAALALARRRRLGPYRAPEERAARRQKDLAAFARAGFASSLARRIVDAESPEALRALLEAS
jgi:regulatory protein